jgi:hypothetical protein
MPHCPVPECNGRQFSSNAGLASHMFLIHKITRTGEPIPDSAIEARKKHLSEAGLKAGKKRPRISAQTALPMHSPAARKKAAVGIKAAAQRRKEKRLAVAATNGHNDDSRSAYYLKLAEKGTHRCPECAQQNHRTRDFTTAVELGRHRRFTHGILGRNNHKTQAALERRHAANAANGAAVTPEGRVQCPECQKTFKNPHGLSVHISTTHRDESRKTKHKSDSHKTPTLVPTTPTAQELIHVNGSTKGIHSAQEDAGRSHRDAPSDAAYVTTIAVTDLAGKLEGFILAASVEYDLPPRQFARRVIHDLARRYTT